MSRSRLTWATRFPALLAFGGLVAAATVLGTATAAQAHNYLVSSSPAANQTLTELPATFEITTNEDLLNLDGKGAGFALRIVDAKGLYYGDGCVTVKNATMSVAPQIGAAGSYTVIWQVVSADGHTVSDEFPFTWAPADASAPVSTGTTTPQTCGGTSGGAAPAVPESTAPAASAAPANADLGDVLWIGGAVVAVGLAIGVTIFVVGRRKKDEPAKK
ncbi:copper resistance CopC family protein [Glaciihabitans sp. dw_435]|uniref:copper resistance CopC family protein n=1 Tax=Glaciihabitans sp. dw_435 TaxID=2720081 RepID=UPI001BD353CC|nr:copper resistance CopC family protein [Glaciihabitans sp. dw_435]